MTEHEILMLLLGGLLGTVVYLLAVLIARSIMLRHLARNAPPSDEGTEE